MECSEKKFQGKVNEKIASEIALSQVELAKKIAKLKRYLRTSSHCTRSCVISPTSHKKPAREFQPWREI